MPVSTGTELPLLTARECRYHSIPKGIQRCVRADARATARNALDYGSDLWNNYVTMPRKTGTRTMTELLREAIAGADTLLGIQKATGVKRAALRKFRDGQQSLRLDMADRLATYFGIECRRVLRARQ
jgi:hypothetical protein